MRIRPTMPSHTTVAAYLALFVAMSGTAYAATGGTFVLGKRNTASTTSKLRNPAGTPLKLVARSGYPPLRVGSSVRVPHLNADRLDGLDASAFLPVGGKAINAETLDGLDSTAFLLASGTASDSARLGGLASTEFQRDLSGGAVLSHFVCPAGTFRWGSVELQFSGSTTTSTWEVCSVV